MGKSSCGKRHCIHEQHHPIQADPVFGDLARESSKVTAAAPLRAVLGAGGRAVKESSTVAVWDSDTGELRAQMKYKNLVTCLIFVPELRVAVTGDGSFSQSKPQGRVVLWNPDSLEQHLKLTCLSTVTCVAWSAADQVLISSDRSHCICLWQPESGAKLQEIRTDAAYIPWQIATPLGEERSTFAYSLCGFKENFGRLCLYRVDTTEQFGDFEHPVLSAVFLPESSVVACGLRNGDIFCWDVEARRLRTRSVKMRGAVNSLALNLVRGELVAGDKTGAVCSWPIAYMLSD
ncbi:pkwA [Symbiodinium pilosum]|uniref:PkwA protein n=1 Tax=Symbiodinium pilosum TaxID=2952 RepID=A0A812TRH1_SYMPI|nr:pkwA [Symbiodinium pilosum]